ncbi:MAG: efflux RND transporter periplasmic adaptor subunit [Bacteroidetes bacterium]|nr:efflux RND transporter periplasmic adaptor subunit [Bacteroidota bacterium]
MRPTGSLIFATLMLAACGGNQSGDKAAQLKKLKQEREDIELKISKLEAEVGKTNGAKAIPVSILTLEPQQFVSTINIQASITGDENVLATPQAPGVVKTISVSTGERVSRGQTLATLDASALQQQMQAMDAQLNLAKTLYEKQQKLWAQNIGTQVQLLQSKTQYESLQSQRNALAAQRDMYTIKSPISGVVDAVNIKVGDLASPGTLGIRVVSKDKLKALANLGENYIGKVSQGDVVTLVFPDLNDSFRTKLSYVAQSVDPISRAFNVEVRLGTNNRLHPNMSCKMKIANYENNKALLVPVSIIQNTSDGNIVFLADGNKAKSVKVEIGKMANGMAEIINGLKDGDKIITAGFEDLDDGETIAIQ